MECGVEYDATSSNNNNKGRKVAISPGSQEETLIANWMESHCGFRMTTILVNEHRREAGLERVSRYAVMSAFHRLNPKVKLIEKVQSGGNNEDYLQAPNTFGKAGPEVHQH